MAVVQVLCGLGFLVWALVSWSPFGSRALTVFVVVVTAGFLAWAGQTWWRAEHAARPVTRPRAAPAPSPPEPRPPDPSRPDPSQPDPPPADRPLPDPPPADRPLPGRPPAAPPSLSPADERELARVVAVLAAEGVFAPEVPDPAELTEAVADAGPPVTAHTVLTAMGEAGFYHPGFRIADHTANAALHHSQVEQFTDTLREQADDLLRLAGDGLAGVTVAVAQGPDDGSVAMPIRLRVRAGGIEQVLDYAGRAKALSTMLHVALARLLRERATGRRLAWLWSDAGPWVTTLADGSVTRLNAALGPAAGEGWEWVDEQEPDAAGEPGPPVSR